MFVVQSNFFKGYYISHLIKIKEFKKKVPFFVFFNQNYCFTKHGFIPYLKKLWARPILNDWKFI